MDISLSKSTIDLTDDAATVVDPVVETEQAGAVRTAGTARQRAFDLVIGSVLCVALAPVMLLLALGAALSFRTWPFFVQERLGRDGEVMRFPKIRSLPPDTPRYADKYALRPVQTTAYGRFLRQTHLDELPQLFLVVAGRMSLVGPRPEMASVASTFDPGFVAVRCRARPGCTGLWQISEAAGGLIGEAPEYDLYYLRRGSVRMNLWILAHTVRQIRPAAEPIVLADVPSWVEGDGLLGEAIDLSAGEVTPVTIDLTADDAHVNSADTRADESIVTLPAGGR